jgi:hypothetical protein
MTSHADDSTVDDLLHQLSGSFLLDEPIAGNRLGDLLAETIRDAGRRPLPDLGQAGDRHTVRQDVEEPLTFLYRPHLFPDMDETLRLGHAVQFHLLPRGLPPDTPVDAAAVLESYCLLSGDLFGWRGEGNGTLTLWLIDVSGHGVRAGFARRLDVPLRHRRLPEDRGRRQHRLRLRRASADAAVQGGRLGGEP